MGLGLGLSTDNKGDSRFGLRGTFDQTWVNQLGASWGTAVTLGNAPSLYSEFFQPLNLDRAAFVAPFLDINMNPDSVFLGNRRVARYNVTRTRIGSDLGTTLREAEVRVGLYYGQTQTAIDTGTPLLPASRVHDNGVRGRLVYDTLDSAGAPRFGTRLAVDVLNPLTALGANLEYTRAMLQFDTAYSRGANTLALKLKGGSSFGKQMPYYDQFPMGGFPNLSGYANEQVRGGDMAFGALIYYRKIASLSPPIGRGLYLGASLEGGWLSAGKARNPNTGENVILSKQSSAGAGSIFFGSDTWIGPAYLGFGVAGGGDRTVYVLIGRP